MTLEAEDSVDVVPDGPRTAKPMYRWLRHTLSPARIGVVYVLIVLIAVFSLLMPDIFPNGATVRQILNGNSVAALAALSIVVPLSTGVFDISGTFTMALSGIMASSLIVYSGFPVWLAVLLAILASLAVGVFNGIIVVILKIDSLIGTLAGGFVITAMVQWRSGNRTVTSPELIGTFQDLAIARPLWGLTWPVFYTVFVALVLWYLLEHRAVGRHLYATGFNLNAARLAGVRTDVLQFGTLLLSAMIAGFAGIVLASTIGAGSPSASAPYLLPAFAAVFLGATQFKSGRINVGGTMISILLLGTLTTGLSLKMVDLWIQRMITGLVLISALALTGLEVRRAGSRHVRSKDRAKSSGAETV